MSSASEISSRVVNGMSVTSRSLLGRNTDLHAGKTPIRIKQIKNSHSTETVTYVT